MLKNILKSTISILLLSTFSQNLFAEVTFSQNITDVSTPSKVDLTTTYHSWAIFGADGDIDTQQEDGNNDNIYEKKLNSAIFNSKIVYSPEGCEIIEADDSELTFKFTDGSNTLATDGEDSFQYLPIGSAYGANTKCSGYTTTIPLSSTSGDIDFFLKNYNVAFKIKFYINNILHTTESLSSSVGYKKIAISFSGATRGDVLRVEFTDFTTSSAWGNIALLGAGSTLDKSLPTFTQTISGQLSTTIDLTTIYNSWAIFGSDGNVDTLQEDGKSDNRYEKKLNSTIFDIRSVVYPRGCEIKQADNSEVKFQFSDGTNKLVLNAEDSFKYIPLGSSYNSQNSCTSSTIILALKEPTGSIDIFLKNYNVGFDINYYTNSILVKTATIESSVGYKKITINFANATDGDTLRIEFSNFTKGDTWANIALLAVGSTQESSFFSRDSSGIVSDSKREVQWQDDYSDNGGNVKEVTSWSNALTYCEGLTLGGLDDWRLPNINEIGTIIDESRYAPAVDNNYFTKISPLSGYWSSTTMPNHNNNNTDAVWVINTRSGTISGVDKETYTSNIICVRNK